jgi:hypothetical protein
MEIFERAFDQKGGKIITIQIDIISQCKNYERSRTRTLVFNYLHFQQFFIYIVTTEEKISDMKNKLTSQNKTLPYTR